MGPWHPQSSVLSLHNTDTISFPLFNSRFLRYNKQQHIFFQSHCLRSSDSQHDRGLFHFRRVVFSVQLNGRVDITLTKVATLRVNLNIDGVSITSRTHTHPSHSQPSRLLTSSLSLGVPVPSVSLYRFSINKKGASGLAVKVEDKWCLCVSSEHCRTTVWWLHSFAFCTLIC